MKHRIRSWHVAMLAGITFIILSGITADMNLTGLSGSFWVVGAILVAISVFAWIVS
jgi:hypothetical protein